ncbi:hypothetical protein CQ12_37950 [Bradyrhizobium jicamae]|uniref:Uncharacterized protein n=1 Tax=Bradyrhizobium jicamae TaxID=280332 RepID=A0A0R3L787_9BRAD|nr:hypothetical protein [Bradyrhizobium jicamae]KRR03706.1 hypothetical protein CQ12_37950 [Bradyrhizobium jicamae]
MIVRSVKKNCQVAIFYFTRIVRASRADPSIDSSNCVPDHPDRSSGRFPQRQCWRTLGAELSDRNRFYDRADDEWQPRQHDNPKQWAAGGRPDAEQDYAEFGVGDYDGLTEQVGPQDYHRAGLG